jgi:tetratricopeptide (TPR) repeat protein
MAETQLELANSAADRARYTDALALLEEARRLAVSADDPDLLIRTALSRGNILFYLGNRPEADAEWRNALTEAENSHDTMLAAVCRLYTYRADVLTGTQQNSAEIIRKVNAELPALKNNTLYSALAYTVIGLAEKTNARFSDAEKAVMSALQIHQKENYLELAAYDWYLIASIRSVAGDYKNALEALQNAVAFDRRAENTHGLGMDYTAEGDIYTKTGDTTRAKEAYNRAAAIFAAAGMENETARAEKSAEN